MILCASAGCATSRPSGPQPPFKAVVGPVIIAHRGGSLEVPENTLAAMRHGVAVGADWQELDITLSRDGVPVVIHDPTLDRTTAGKGNVEDHTAAALGRFIAGAPTWSDAAQERLSKAGVVLPKFGELYKNEFVPTLEQVLAIADTRLMIEMKHSSRDALLVDRALEVIGKARAHDRVAIGSFEYETLQRVYAKDPSLPLIGIVEDAALIDTMLELPISVLAVHTSLVEEAFKRAPAGVAIWVWTVYSPKQALELAELGVHGIITDVPQAVVKALRPSEP